MAVFSHVRFGQQQPGRPVSLRAAGSQAKVTGNQNATDEDGEKSAIAPIEYPEDFQNSDVPDRKKNETGRVRICERPE